MPIMLGIGAATRVYLAIGATDMRKGFEGLFGIVRDRLLIDPELFKVDRQARDQGLTTEARHALRIVNSEPLLEEIRSRIEAARGAALPKSLPAKAANYTLSLWPRLNRFLEYP